MWLLVSSLFTSVFSFNPHTHEGCDLLTTFIIMINGRFQSTHPRRVWRIEVDNLSIVWQFQSTHPRRVWQATALQRYKEIQVSIHTPTKGVTQSININIRNIIVSIHTPTKGVTHHWWSFNLIGYVSIHTPTKGVTAYSANSWISWCKDNYFAKDGKIITRKIL